MSSKGYNLDCNLGYDSFEDCVYYDVLSATSRIRGAQREPAEISETLQQSDACHYT